MDNKLEALADVIEEWPEEVRVNVTLRDNGRVVSLDWNTDGEYGKSDWLSARQSREESRMDIVGTNGNDGLHYDPIMTEEEETEYAPAERRSKYHVEIRPGVWVDVYDVLTAYAVTNPADAHAIKKMLCPGKRGVKSANQDRREAIASLKRAIELESHDER